MTKKVLLKPNYGDDTIYVEKTSHGNEYYVSLGGEKPEKLSKKEMKDVVHNILNGIVFETYNDPPFIDSYCDEDLKRIKKMAPELLPDSFDATPSSNSVKPEERRMLRDESHPCPQGYEYVKSYHKQDRTYVKGFCRKIKRN